MTVDVAWGSATDRGLRRPANEDAFLAAPPVFLVADGMGGHEAGAEASQAALAGFDPLIGRVSVTVQEAEAAFRDAAARVDAIEAARYAAGTTLAGVLLSEVAGLSYWLVLNIGDSRVYRLAGGSLEQISTDHSAVQAMVDRGELDAAQAERHPQRSVITRAVGAGSTGLPDYWVLPAESGDRMLVCSDGLTKELSADEIRRILAAEPAPQSAATRLIHEALLRGGRDNVTVVVVDAQHVVEGDDDPTRPGEELDDDTAPRHGGPEEGTTVAHV